VPGYRLVGNTAYPDIVADYRRTFRVLRSLRCQVFLGAHGSFFSLLEKAHRVERGRGVNPFVDPQGCRAHIDDMERAFEARVRQQTGDDARPRPRPRQEEHDE
jgi:metallo-beta-lactamase class B